MAIRGTNNGSNNGGYGAEPNYGDGVSPGNLNVPEEEHPVPTVANPVWDGAPWDAMCEHELEGHQADSEESYVDLRHDPETGNLVLTVHNLGPYSPVAIREVVGWEDPGACGLSDAYLAKREARRSTNRAIGATWEPSRGRRLSCLMTARRKNRPITPASP